MKQLLPCLVFFAAPKLTFAHRAMLAFRQEQGG